MGYRNPRAISLEFLWAPNMRGRSGVVSKCVDTRDQSWQAQALCAQTEPELFFAPGAVEHRTAKKICRSCPVRKECLSYAMDAAVDHGIWGGLTERERRNYRRKAGAAGWRSLVVA